MAHSLTTASHSSAAAELGISVGTNRTQTSLTRHATINKWSFYRPGSIAPDGSYYVQLTAPSNNDKLGDFRGYNHSAFEPYPFPVYPSGKTWGPGGSTISLTFQVYVEETNYRKLYSGSQPYITIRYYMTSAARDARSGGHVRTYTTTLSETSNSPPTGHTNNQTQRPASASQLITDSAFPTSYLASPDDVIYCDLYFSDISGNEVVRFGSTLSDGHVDIDTHENQQPFVDCVGPGQTSPTYNPIYIVVTNSSSAKDGADIAATFGSSSYPGLYWYLVGLSGSTWYRIGSINVTVTLRIYNPEYGTSGATLQNTTTMLNGNLNVAGSSSNQNHSSGGSLASGYTWAYDDVGDMFVTVNSWSGVTTYSLGTTAPTCV